MPRRRKGLERRIARERIEILFGLAEEEAAKGNRPRAARYAQLARRIGMRYNVPLPSPFRRFFCRTCEGYLDPGSSASVRLRRSRVIITCKACGSIYRYPYLREVKERRRASSRR
ncbi:MAG: ribonuclease P protein component 4 [Thermoplasmata archaeon]